MLSDRGIATGREVAAPEPWVGAVRPPDAWALVRRIDPSRPGALSLLLATTLVDGEPFGLDIGIADAAGPPVLLETLPDCGCDACDSGSADLLLCLDDRVLSVARGGVLHARGRDRTATPPARGLVLQRHASARGRRAGVAGPVAAGHGRRTALGRHGLALTGSATTSRIPG